MSSSPTIRGWSASGNSGCMADRADSNRSVGGPLAGSSVMLSISPARRPSRASTFRKYSYPLNNYAPPLIGGALSDDAV